jgi:phosphoserine phosphatase
MTKIVLTRHGHVEGIEPERFRGREPLPLTKRGQAEAAAVAQRIAGAFRPSHIYTSPMGRCIETATAIAEATGAGAKTWDAKTWDAKTWDAKTWDAKTWDAKTWDAKTWDAKTWEPKICDDLNDIDYGAWQFKSFAEAKAQDPSLFAAWFATPHLIRFPNGESLQDLVARAANALRMVLARHPDETVVLVGHDSVNRALLLGLLDQPLSAYWRVAQAPCCINEIDVTGGTIRVRRINETQHLEAIAAEYGRS